MVMSLTMMIVTMMMVTTMRMVMVMLMNYPKCEAPSARFIKEGEEVMRVWTYVVWTYRKINDDAHDAAASAADEDDRENWLGMMKILLSDWR